MSSQLRWIHHLIQNGKVREAMSEAKTSLMMAHMSGHADHPECAELFDVMGTMHRMLGNFDQAVDFHRQALAIDIRHHGETHQNVASTLGNMAGALEQAGRFDEAEPLFRRALGVMEAIHEPSSMELAIPCSNLGCVLERMGRAQEAEQLHRRAVGIFEQRSGGRLHLHYGMVRHNLGVALESQGRLQEAEVEMRAGLVVLSTHLGDGHEAVKNGVVRLNSILAKIAGEDQQLRSPEGPQQ